MLLSDRRTLNTAYASLAVCLFLLIPFLHSLPHFSHDAEVENYSRSRRSVITFGITEKNAAAKLHPDKPLYFPSSEGENKPATSAQCLINVTDRFDCFPENPDPNPNACQARGCCYDKAAKAPACFFSMGTVTYRVVSLDPIRDGGGSIVGLKATLERNSTSAYPADVMHLVLLVLFETEYRLRFKIYDPSTQRYEVPMDLHDNDNPTPFELTQYTVNITKDPFSISILRKTDGQILFDSKGMSPLIFADQYLQIGSRLSSRYVYGLGNHQSSLLLDVPGWQKLIFWNRDQPPTENVNLYGSHPFYINLEPSGKAHGVFLLNSNALQVDLQPYQNTGAITYRVLGGVLDFFVFTGPNADTVVSQYVSLIGYPYMPPFWALGFQLCRHGYGNSSELWKVIQRNRAAKMPYDIQYTDLDYAQNNLAWTWDDKIYRGLPDIVSDLHAHGQHYLIITEPGVSSSQPPGSYLPFDLGKQKDVFIKNATGGLFVGKVWPGMTAFVDFFHPNVSSYWLTLIMKFHEVLPFDGLWIDMNEPANFIDGSIYGCTNNTLDKPPFIPPGIDGGTMYARTMCPSARQYLSSHYNLHNLYGWSQISITMQSLQLLYNRRTLVLTRSSAPGSGAHGAQWTGDNFSGFPDMYFSITALITSNMFGIPMTGSEVCGFRGDATRELCIRWMQLGAFYPFMRNHAELGTLPQDPGWWDTDAQDVMRSALELRYSLLPFMYTRFFLSHITGAPCVRPLFFDYAGTEAIDRQFLWGSELLVSPVLEEGATSVNAYIPKGTWFDLETQTLFNVTGNTWHTLPAPLNKINVHVRGGSILPMMPPAITTTLARQQKMELLVAPDLTPQPVVASGQLYWDDGDVLEPVVTGAYSLVTFLLAQTTLRSQVQKSGYSPVTLGKVTVMGVGQPPVNVTLNDHDVPFTYNLFDQVLVIYGLSVDLLSPFSLTWH